MGQPNPAEGATPPAEPTEPAKTEPATGDGLGDAGRKALAEERAARKELEKQLKELQQQQRDPVKAIAEALGVKPAEAKPDDLAVTVKQLQEDLAAERIGRVRLEVAAAKGMTTEQAAELRGATREELEAHADRLKALFPTTATPGVPAPDPTQGSRGLTAGLETQLKAAQDKGDAREAIRLKTLIAAQRQGK